MNINEAHSATLATFIDQLLDGDIDNMTKGEVAVHVLDLMVANLNEN